jgi:hypothetical protein
VTVKQQTSDEMALKALRLLREIGASREMMERVLGCNGLPQLEAMLDGQASESEALTIEAIATEVPGEMTELDDGGDD